MDSPLRACKALSRESREFIYKFISPQFIEQIPFGSKGHGSSRVDYEDKQTSFSPDGGSIVGWGLGWQANKDSC
jgi:hypothetical protein